MVYRKVLSVREQITRIRRKGSVFFLFVQENNGIICILEVFFMKSCWKNCANLKLYFKIAKILRDEGY